MPSVSKAERRAAGMARAIQKGEMKAVPGTPSAEMAKMNPEDLKHFAETKETGLPEHKKKLRRMGSKSSHRKPQGVRKAG